MYYAEKGGSNFWLSGWNPLVLQIKWKLLSSTLTPVSVFVMLCKIVLTFESVDEIL